MLIILQEFVLQLIIWILKFADSLAEIFSVVACEKGVVLGDGERFITEYILSTSPVENILICMAILSIGLACIFAVVAVIKNMVSSDRNLSVIVGRLGLSVLGMAVMVIFMILIILISGKIMEIVTGMFGGVSETNISSSILDGLIGEYINGYGKNDIDIDTITVKTILGDYDSGALFPSSWNYNGMANPDSFMYLPGLIVSICFLIGFFSAVMCLTRNLYETVLLYIIMPVSMATLPLDNGERFRGWRESFFSRIILMFAEVVSVNVYLLAMPLFSNVSLINGSEGLNSLFRLILMASGSLLLTSGPLIFGRVFGADLSHTGLNSELGAIGRYGREFVHYGFELPTRIISNAYREGVASYRHRIISEETESARDESMDNYLGGLRTDIRPEMKNTKRNK